MAPSTRKQSWFVRFSKVTAYASSRPVAFLGAILLIFIWAISGPIFGYNDTWQLIVNTGTSIITFLMVFLIQNTQNRDTEALQIKIDELLCAVENANKALLDLEELDDEQLDRIRDHYERLAARARDVAHARLPDEITETGH